MEKHLLLLAMLLLPMVARAYIAVENADGVTIYYNYIKDGTELEVVNIGSDYIDKVVIPEEVTYMNRTRKVTSIHARAFYECSGLTSVTIPNSVTSIGEKAFYELSYLTSVTIGNGVSSVDKDVFYHCYGLKKVIVSDIAAWCSIKFSNEFSNPLRYACHLYSDENTEIKDLVIPNNVTSIEAYVFIGCRSLTSVTIPNSVTSIGCSAFDGCGELKKVIVSDIATWCGIKFGDQYANPLLWAKHLYSDENTEIKDLVIPNSVTSISNLAFYYCSGLTSITIGSGVTSIGSSAFDGWDIPVVISLIKNPFKIIGKTSSGIRTFNENTFNNATLYVPKGTKEKYKATEGWWDFLYIEERTDGGTTSKKCANPTISYNNGKLTYYCETEGAMCQSTITDADIKSYSSNEVQLGVTYNISVYATKSGYDNSETATATLCWIDKEPTTEGITDGVAQVPSKAVLIQSEGGILKVEGIDDGTQVAVYTPDGKQAGSAVCRNGAALVGTNIQPGNTAIVKIGEKSVKVIVK